MGNRAVITTRENFKNNGIGVYLHWNGGRDSVEAFLEYCKIRGFRSPETDNYGFARLVQVIANFMGIDGLSVGVDILSNLDCDNGDNGVYIVKNWQIVGRENFVGVEQHHYNRKEMLQAIDEANGEVLGAQYFDAEEVPVKSLKIGDTVIVRDWKGEIHYCTVKGFGADRVCNGTNVYKMPFIDLFNNGDYTNINNYLTGDKVLKVMDKIEVVTA